MVFGGFRDWSSDTLEIGSVRELGLAVYGRALTRSENRRASLSPEPNWEELLGNKRSVADWRFPSRDLLS